MFKASVKLIRGGEGGARNVEEGCNPTNHRWFQVGGVVSTSTSGSLLQLLKVTYEQK